MRTAVVLFAGFMLAALSAPACSEDYDAAPSTVPVDDASQDDDGTTPDASTEAAIDAGPDTAPAACDRTKPFGDAVPLQVGMGTFQDAWPRLSADELDLVFASDRSAPGDFDLFYATRLTTDVPFGAPLRLANLASGELESHPFLSGDGLRLYFFSRRPTVDGGSPDDESYVATRAKRTDSFGVPTRLSFSGSDIDSQAVLARFRNETWFRSTRPGGAGQGDLYRVTGKPGGAVWEFDDTTLAAVSELNTPSDEWAPTLSADGLTIYFASTRIDGGAKGLRDIWKATRANVNDPFGLPSNVAELNTVDADAPSHLSDDECRLYFHRRSVAGTERMFVATKPK